LTQSSGSVPSTTIYVRLKANATVAGSPYAGNIVLSSTGATNVNVPTVSSSVTAKALTISGITADIKVYDATTTASLSGSPTYVGLENSEIFSVPGTPTATFATASVGNMKTVSVLGYTAPSTNYTLTQPILSANITPAPLTITSPSVSNKVYDGNNAATLAGSLSGVIGSEVVTLNLSGTFSQFNVGTALSVISTSTITGMDAGNYSLTQPSGLTANITTKPLTISGLSANNKVFDGNTTATLSGTATLNGIVGTDNVTLTGTPSADFANSNVGNGIAVTVTGYSLTGSSSGNYTVSQPTGLTADITNLPTPSISSSLTSSATYGVIATSYFITATNSPTSYNATNLPTGLSINTSTGEISGTPTDVAGSPFNVTISATNNGGTGTATLVYNINPKILTVSSPSVPNKVYDRTNAATITGTLTGIIGTDVVTLSGTGTFSQSTVGTSLNVTSTSTLTGADASKYSLTQPTGLTGEIVVKPLTVSGATASNKVYDGTNMATLTGATLNGIISPDDVTLTGGAIFSSTDVANNISINTSSLVSGGADAVNYIALPIIGLTANITPKSLIVSGLSANNKVYDGNISATLTGTASLNGIIGTDDVSLSGTPTTNFNDKNIGTSKPITVSGYTLTGTESGNYSVTQPTGLTANITAKSLTITSPIAQNKVFDGNTNAIITGTLVGIILPDVVTLVGTGTFATSAIGNGIAVTSTSTLSGAENGNYNLTQPTGLTANITGPPTIVIDVATTSNYVDGGILTSPTSPYSLSGVISDPTDPAKTLGIDFTINDASVLVGNLTVTAISSNISVVPNANLVLTGAGASRNLKISPVGEGFATITVTVNNGSSTTSFSINYAASNASVNTATTRFHTGTSDASTAQVIDNNLMFVGDDENQGLRLYDRQNSGLPIKSFDYTTSLGLTDVSGGVPREVDIEASAKVGNRIYWMGSHSNASNGNVRPNRYRFFATDIAGTGNGTTLSYVGRYDNLKTDLLAWDANNGHGLGANFLGLTASGATGKAPETSDGSGFNIEGLEIAPNNTTAYICFRAPVETPTARTKALIIPLTNFASLVSGNPTSTTATFGNPIQLDLGGRAIREMKRNASGEYLIIAGPHDGSTGIAPKDFRFYTWTGNPNDAPILRSANLTALNSGGSFESIVDLPSPLVATSNIQVLVDNGDAVFYGNGVIAKDLAQNNHKKFRSETINLGTEILPLVTIKSITTGNWESTTTWNLGRIPQAGDLVIIDQNHEVTLNGNGNVKKIEYQGTGKLKFNSAASTLNTGL
jgi:YDG domain